MSALWTASDAAEATGGTATAEFEVSGLSIDTRSIAPGEMFVALKDRRDGHDFVADAFAAGASAALVERRPEGVAGDAPLLIVPDVLDALRDLARAARARTRAKVIGITGSVGKTSTKEMLRHVLSRQGQVHAAEKSFNNHWGVPLTLARCPADADFAVIEIGMSHPGEIAPLAALAAPDVAIVTIVAAAHLEAFEGLAGIAEEKAAIFLGLRTGGVAIPNGDLETTPILTAAARKAGATVVSFGTAAEAAARLERVDLADGQTHLTARIAGRSLDVILPTAGRHFAMNAVATLAAVSAVGADPAQAAEDLSDWATPAGRGTRSLLHLPAGPVTLLDDAYNANPTSMAAALEALGATAPQPGGRRVAVLGDMLELGPDEAAIHAGLAALPALASADKILCVGPRMAALDAALPAAQRAGHVDDAEAATLKVRDLLGPGDVILVKGSFGSRVSQVVNGLRKLAEAEEQGR